nr:MAG TPA: hypothetical protein [Caudoviricetes sp.]
MTVVRHFLLFPVIDCVKRQRTPVHAGVFYCLNLVENVRVLAGVDSSCQRLTRERKT